MAKKGKSRDFAEDWRPIREAIVARMKQREISISDLSDATDIAYQNLHSYLTGKRDPKASTIARIMEPLGLKVRAGR